MTGDGSLSCGYTMTWDGRQLATLSGNGISSASYRYDADGLRVSKTVNGSKTDYHYVNGLLMHEKRSDIDVYYTYNSSGNLSSIRYRYPNLTTDSYYLVVCNSRGDVSDIYAPDGTLRARYTYDAWGNIISIKDGDGNPVSPNNTYHVGNVNSIRYRGYYYDTETGRYYCQGRYYDPEVGRFLNADGYVSTGQGILGINMFSYCGNNPVNRADPTGMFWKEIGDFFSNAWNGIKTWAKNTFGTGTSITCTYHSDETEILPEPLPITIKTDTRTSAVVSKSGDSTKPISVYSSTDISNKKTSVKSGLKINSEKAIFDANFGINRLQISGTSINENNENSFGITVDRKSMRVEFEYSSVVVWDGTTTGTHTTMGANILFFASFFIKVPVNQTNWTTAPAY